MYMKDKSRMLKKMLTIRVTEGELSILKSYAEQTGRSQSDLLRELIRALERKLSPAATQAKPARLGKR